MKIGIVGGGFHGLVLGHLLSKEHEVSIFEKDVTLGGLLQTADFKDFRLEKYYHHIFLRDSHIVELFRELGIENELGWHQSTTSVFAKGKFFPFFKPMELLRFPHLGIFSKLRLGLATLFLQNLKKGEKLNHLNAKAWIKKVMGSEAWEVLWRPLFEGKFSRYSEEISLSWFWSRISYKRGSKTGKDEVLGYPKESFQIIIDKLIGSIVKKNGKIFSGKETVEIVIDGGRAAGIKTKEGNIDFDLIISTVAPPLFLKLIPGAPDAFKDELKKIRYLGAITAILVLKEKLAPAYWNNILDVEIPFKAVIEQTNLDGSARYGAKHLAYTSHYTPVDSEYFKADNAQLIKMYMPHLKKINGRAEENLLEYRIYRDCFCQPIISVDYPQAIIDFKTPITNLYQFSMAQIFPEDRGLNIAVREAKKIVLEIAEKFDKP
ncbi:MAG: NAD(P)/FAD-dependent oxidoreductase [Patescibacteria group bacterium]|jgi:protoporphyrinogen oxidase